MTAANFNDCLDIVLIFEGGYSDLATDPGGPTSLGITQAVLAEWRGHAVTKDDVRLLTKTEAALIYRARYWAKVQCDVLPSGVDLAVFDCAVNQGVGRASRFLQSAARVTVDGHIGPKTLAAVDRANPRVLLNEFMAQRMNAYGRLQSLFLTFGLGWSRRLMGVHTDALGMLGQLSATSV